MSTSYVRDRERERQEFEDLYDAMEVAQDRRRQAAYRRRRPNLSAEIEDYLRLHF